MSDDHRRIREQLGALAIGVADPRQRAALEAHLAGCAQCREELARLEQVAGALSVLAGEPASVPFEAPRSVAERLFTELAVQRRRRGRRARVWASAGAAVAAALAVLAVVVLPTRGAPAPQPREVVFLLAPAGVSASAEVRDWRWGSQVYLEITGLPDDQLLGVWLQRPDGTRVSAGSFTTTGGDLRMTLGAGTATADATALGISDPTGATILQAPL